MQTLNALPNQTMHKWISQSTAYATSNQTRRQTDLLSGHRSGLWVSVMDPLLNGLSENCHMPGVVGKHDEYCFLQSAEPTVNSLCLLWNFLDQTPDLFPSSPKAAQWEREDKGSPDLLIKELLAILPWKRMGRMVATHPWLINPTHKKNHQLPVQPSFDK